MTLAATRTTRPTVIAQRLNPLSLSVDERLEVMP